MYLLYADDKKEDIRSKVWKYLDKNELSQLFAPYKKISNFKVCLNHLQSVVFLKNSSH